MANKKVSQLTSKPSVLTTDLFPIADPSTGQLFKTTISDLGTAIGSGVSSVNTLVGAVVLDTDDIQELVSPTNKWFTDTRARAALSASSPLTYNSGTGAFGIQVATGSQNGYLSSTDWTTFNAKQAALSGTGFVKISGTTISYDNSTYLTTSAAASTYLALAGGTLTGALNGTSATFTGDLTISSTNPRIYLTDTDNNPDYFISNTDGTFTVYDVTNSLSRFTIGTTGNAYFRNAITGGGSITGESIYSNGIISAGTSLSVGTFVSAGGSLTGSALYVTGMTAGSGAIYHTASRLTFANYNTSGTLHFEVNGGTGALTLNSDKSATFQAGGTFAGSVHIGGSSPVLRLDVSGNASDTTTVGGATVEQVTIFRPSNGTGGIRTGFNTTSGDAYIWSANSGSSLLLGVRIAPNNNVALTLASTGAATFASSVTANSTNGIAGTFKSSEFFGSIDLENTGGTATGKWNVQSVSGAQVGGTAGSSFGIYSYGASAYRMFITSSGNVGIGTTSPSDFIDATSGLAVMASSGRAGITIGSTQGTANEALGRLSFTNTNSSNAGSKRLAYISGIRGTTDNSAYLEFGTADNGLGTQRMVISQAGNVGIGTTSPNTRLHTTGSFTVDDIIYLQRSSSSLYLPIANYWNGSGNPLAGTKGDILAIGNAGGDGLVFVNSNTERMRITSSGNVSIGYSAAIAGSPLGVVSSGASQQALSLWNTATSGTRYLAEFSAGSSYTAVGSITTNGTTTSYNVTSDYRLKEDLKTINGLEIVNKIKVYDYKWKSENSRMDGVLAHELAEVLPYAVQGSKDGEQMQSVDYSKIVPVLIQAIKDQQIQIEQLKNK